VQVFSGGANVATTGAAKQSSASNGGVASRAIDGNTSGRYSDGGQTHSREGEENPWWELDLGKELPIEAVTVWNRTEGKGQFVSRLEGFTLRVLDASRGEAFVKAGIPAPPESARIDLPAGGADAIRRSAMSALAATGKDDAGNFRLLAKLLREGKDRDGAIRALSRVPRAGWPKEDLPPLIDALLEQIAALAPEDRTQPAARDAFQLGDDAASLLAPKEAQAARKRLRELGVPVFVIRPVAQLMVYDRSKIFVEAGKPVEIVFENADIMPHNLIITRPHALEKVGLAAEKMVADPAAFAKSFVPDLPEVLHATKLLQPQQTFRLSFTAPSEPDEYPYVCTFPGHWRRMYGAMVVVKSLDDVPPEVLASAAVAAPSGPTRPFVRSWTMEDLAPRLEHAGHGRSVAAGKELFGVLSCNRCHRMNGEGGQVGPDLVQVKQKLSDRKATLEDVLREIIEPSKVVEEKFRAQTLVLTDGRLVTGIVEAESDQEVRMRVNPLDGKEDTATVIPKEQIQERVPSEVSLMPMGLLNTLSDEEVLDLLAYVSGAGG